MLENITPVVLTYNEAPNIGRTLDALGWARAVVVLDSGSTDKTKEIVSSYANAQWFERAFDNHQAQWQYRMPRAAIDAKDPLALENVMEITPAFKNELK